jgi:hypothetical protein
MPLEPETIGVEDEGKIKSLSRKFWIGLALTIPVLILAISTPVIVWSGGIFFIRAMALRR